ncbi:MAG: energy transducer TonB [Elainellaceae cyanobacterium]
MNISQKYRLQFTSPRLHLIVGYWIAAVLINVGFILASMGWLTQLSVSRHDSDDDLGVIEFVPVESVSESPAADTEQRAIVDSTAGGTRDPNLPPAAERSATEGSAPHRQPQSTAPGSNRTTPSLSSSSIPSSSSSSPSDRPPIDSLAESLASDRAPDVNQPTPPVRSPSTSSTPPHASSNSAADLLPDPSSQAPSQLANRNGLQNPNRTASGAIGVDAQRDPVWAAYISHLREEIRGNWNVTAVSRTRDAEIEFTINRQGQLENLRLLRPSGSDSADQAALQAVENSAPFEPFPSETQQSNLIVNLTFTYTVY